MNIWQWQRVGVAVAAGAALAASEAALAGPPFLTDDPEPIEYQHSEAYLYSTYDRGPDGSKMIQVPAIEFNTSPIEDVHLHFLQPYNNLYPGDGSSSQHGIGDTELGVKYRFVHETESRPQIGIFPMLEVATGNSYRGLGNGQTWWTFPVWVQKSWGDWTSYGGGGRAFNHATGMRDYNFGGWLLQRKLTEDLILGGELFAEGATSQSGQHATHLNFGGYYNSIRICGDCSLLFRFGHTISGESHTTAYLGLYWSWNWGPEEKK